MTRFQRQKQPRWLGHVLATVFLACVAGLAILKFGRPPSIPEPAANGAPSRASEIPRAGAGTKPTYRHLYTDDARCLANSARGAAPEARVYRWTDAQGVAHFSDRPPADAAGDAFRVESLRDTPPLELRIEARATTLPPHVTSRALADAHGIAKVLRGVLAVETPGRLRLNVVIVGTDAAFARELGEPRGDRAGVYVGARRLILVRAQREHEGTLTVLRHEIVHALVHEWIGFLPSALNEGLAEYFEAFAAQGMGGQIDPRRYARRLQRAGLPQRSDAALRAILNAPSREFYAHARHRNYDWSLGLVSTLMSSSEGRRALAATLKAQRLDPCRPVDAAAILAREWRGGLLNLHQSWAAHAAGSALGVHSY